MAEVKFPLHFHRQRKVGVVEIMPCSWNDTMVAFYFDDVVAEHGRFVLPLRDVISGCVDADA